MRRSNEPLFWALFSAGGVLTALLTPVLILMTGLVLPAEGIEIDRATDIFGNALIRLAIFGVFALALFHWANRFRHTIVDMGLGALMPFSVLSYLVALLGIVWSAALLFG